MSAGTFGHNGFQSNLLGWRSSNWGGFTIEAVYGLETDDSSYGYAFKWSIPIVEIFLAGNDDGDLQCAGAAGCTDAYSAIKVGGQLRLGGGNHKISIQYEDTDITTTANDDNSDPAIFFLAYDGKFGGKTHFVAQLGFTDYSDTTNGANDSYSEVYYNLGAIYKFSKETRVFGGLRITADDIENENNAETVWSVGIRKDFKS
jgi:predicted porin